MRVLIDFQLELIQAVAVNRPSAALHLTRFDQLRQSDINYATIHLKSATAWTSKSNRWWTRMSGHIFINQPAFSARIMKSLLNCRSMTRFDWFELISNKTRTATLESLHFLSFSLCLSLSLIHYFFLFFLFFLFSLFFLFFLFIPFSLCLSLCLSVSLSLSLSLSLFSPLFSLLSFPLSL